MARCCDPRENIGGTIKSNFKIGGMKDQGADDEVIYTLNQIDGVVNAKIDESTQRLSVEFDPTKVSEEHLISTLNSLGHSILSDYKSDERGAAPGCPIV